MKGTIMNINQLYIVIGAYGSGKSEYSIQLARELNDKGLDVVLADMDVVNPYFRSRDVKDEFASYGIDVIAPDGEFRHADLPMISPRIKGAIENTSKTVVLDVGGDPAGCRTLGRFVDSITQRGYQMHFVVNTMRPFTASAPEIIRMRDQLEHVSHLKISHLICNTNLMELTDLRIVQEGIRILRDVANTCDMEFEKYLVLEENASLIPEGLDGLQRVVMKYTLRKPWEMLIAKGI